MFKCSKMASGGVRHGVVDGWLPVPRYITQEIVDELRKTLVLREGDVIIDTFPKAGTTWTQQIVKLLRNDGVEDGRRVTDAIPWPEDDLGQNQQFDAEAMPHPRAFKSHMPYHMTIGGLPHTTPAKYIYMARNPKDTAVSHFHHYRGFQSLNFTGDWSEFLKRFIEGKVEFGSWFDHVLGWWEHRDESNMLFLKYEDLKKDLRGGVRKMAEFIGLGHLSDEVINKVAEQCTFGSMKANPASDYAWVASRRNPSEAEFMRKGVVGDWRNYFTEEQNEEFDALYVQRTEGSGLEFEFEA